MNERDALPGPDAPREDESTEPQPAPSAPRKVFFALPDDYWDWTDEQQRAWAAETVKALRQRLGVEPTT